MVYANNMEDTPFIYDIVDRNLYLRRKSEDPEDAVNHYLTDNPLTAEYLNIPNIVNNSEFITNITNNTTITEITLPSQTGNSGKFLTTNGSAASWGTPDSGGAKSVTFVVGPSTNSDADTYDYETDGTADDVQIQAAIDALPTAGGKVVLREGTYTIATTVTIDTGHVTLEGMGGGTIIRPVAGGVSGRVLFINGATSAHLHNLYFDGGNDTTSGVAYVMVDASGTTEFRITNCFFKDCRYTAVESVGEFESVIENCYFLNWDKAQAGSQYAVNSFSGKISGCYFENTYTGANYLANVDVAKIIGNHFKFPNSYNATGISVSGTRFLSNTINAGSSLGASCILVDENADSLIQGNRFSLGATANVASICVNAGDGTVVANNQFYVAGIAVNVYADTATVTGNIIDETRGTAIHVASSANFVVITNNRIHDAGVATDNTYYSIHLDGSNTYCVINGNIITSTHANDTNTHIIEDASCNSNIITSNVATGAQTAQITTVGAATVAANNITA